MEQLLFYGCGGIALASSIGMLLSMRNTVYAALCLVVTMLALAVLFVTLAAEFIGVLQIMVYAGAIVVLFLFVIMLLNLRGGHMGAELLPVVKVVGAALVLLASAQLVRVLSGTSRPWAELPPGFGQVAPIGRALYTDYVLAVEVAGVLLLAGIVGAVVLAKKRLDG
jgi:NADH-quinone oxidoreductase subunit J